jgi:hypothetical protein
MELNLLAEEYLARLEGSLDSGGIAASEAAPQTNGV